MLCKKSLEGGNRSMFKNTPGPNTRGAKTSAKTLQGSREGHAIGREHGRSQVLLKGPNRVSHHTNLSEDRGRLGQFITFNIPYAIGRSGFVLTSNTQADIKARIVTKVPNKLKPRNVAKLRRLNITIYSISSNESTAKAFPGRWNHQV